MELLKIMCLFAIIASISSVDGAICKFTGQWNNSHSEEMTTHIFKDPAFWQHFQDEVHLKSWKCNFPPDILIQNMEKDAALYKDDTIFKKRREGVVKWIKNDTQWIAVIIGACKEIANGEIGIHSWQLKKLHLLEALDDFVEHLNCFYTVASLMNFKGEEVKAFSQHSSQIHDIDKLDPVMLVGYSERFEDNQITSLWEECVNRHTHINPHHQAHCLWHENCCNETCIKCQQIETKALAEMVCDKVSRRLQKNLHGEVSEDMWNVDNMYFNGLPEKWLNKAFEILKRMKK